MKLKKFLCLFFTCFSVNFVLSAQIYGKKQMLPAGHWIYDAAYTLSMESKILFPIDSAPLSVEEIELYLRYIDYEKLNDEGKQLYYTVTSFLENNAVSFDLKPVKFGFNINAVPELLYKSNPEIDWSYATDYTGKLQNTVYHNNETDITYSISSKEYGAGSNFLGNNSTVPVLTLPLFLNFNDILLFESDFYLGKNFWSFQEASNWSNVFLKCFDQDAHWPDYVYASTGKVWDNGLGINFQIAKEGFQWGRSQSGSVIYNNTFETDCYIKLDVYSHNLKYNSDIVEVTNKRFLYLHSFTATPFKWFKFGIMEGSMINAPFEFRYLNPLMCFHSYASWAQYMTKEEASVYNTAHASSYIGLTFDFIPFKNCRLYLNGCMNEMQLHDELKNETGVTIPDGFGFQWGFEYNWANKKGWFYSGIEAVYTTPWLYYKSGADWSLYREKYNSQRKGSIPICSWIGTPFGPDATAVQARIGYKLPSRYSWELNYLFVAHGENSFGLFSQYVQNENGTWNAYYPSVLKKLGLISQEQAVALARSWKHLGTIQYTNSLTASGSYEFNKYVTISAQMAYTFIYNNKNVEGNFDQGVELGLSVEFSLF